MRLRANLAAGIAALLLHAPPTRALEEASEQLASFDHVWSTIAETHFDPALLERIDWDALREELRPRAAQTTTADELRPLLADLLGRLGQSHFGVIGAGGGAGDAGPLPDGCTPDTRAALLDPLSSGPRGPAGTDLELRRVDDEVVVLHPGREDDLAGPRRGWALLSIEEVPVAPLLPCLADLGELADFSLQRWLEHRLSGAPGSRARLSFDTGDGSRELEIERRLPQRQSEAFGNLGPTPVDFESRDLELEDGGRAVLVRFDLWMMPVAAAFDETLPRIRDADGLVLDLRGNPGGVAGLAIGLAGHLLSEKASLGSMRGRRDEMVLNVVPRRSTVDGRRVDPYAGPVAILLDGLSASTSEVFAAGLRDLGRARLFGQPSAGAALPSVIEKLPNGDLFQHALMDFVRPNGDPVEGAPVEPDVVVELRRRDLLEGRDATLEAALDWIALEAR